MFSILRVGRRFHFSSSWGIWLPITYGRKWPRHHISEARITLRSTELPTHSLMHFLWTTNNISFTFCLRELVLEFKVALDITHGLLETSGEPQSKFLIQELKFPKVKNCCSSIDIWGVLWLHSEETPWRISCITSLERPSMTYK